MLIMAFKSNFCHFVLIYGNIYRYFLLSCPIHGNIYRYFLLLCPIHGNAHRHFLLSCPIHGKDGCIFRHPGVIYGNSKKYFPGGSPHRRKISRLRRDSF